LSNELYPHLIPGALYCEPFCNWLFRLGIQLASPNILHIKKCVQDRLAIMK